MARVIRARADVLPRAIVAARTDAARIVADAHTRAMEITESAHRAGLESARAEAATLLASAARARAAAGDEARGDLLRVAVTIAERVVGAAIERAPELAADIVERELARLRRATRLELAVHPDDAPLVAHRLPAFARLVTDPSITRGGCVARADVGTLDARIETKLDTLARALGVERDDDDRDA